MYYRWENPVKTGKTEEVIIKSKASGLKVKQLAHVMSHVKDPCPFCGSLHLSIGCDESHIPRLYLVSCSNCGTKGPKMDSDEKAKGAWNGEIEVERIDVE